MARRPKETRYLGVAVPITFTPGAIPFEGKRARGTYVRPEGVRINSRQSLRELRMTLLHECMHHLIDARGTKLPLRLEETICEWSEFLVDYLNENPSVREYLFNAKASVKRA